MPKRFLFLVVLLCAGTAGVFAVSGHAREKTPIPIIRDGLWTGRDSRGLVIARVRSHRVVSLRFMVTLDCHNHDTGEDYDRAFTGGRKFNPVTIPRAGRLVTRWIEMDAGREGHIFAELDWRGRRYALLASFVVDVPQIDPGLESCLGEADIPAHRGVG